MILKVLVIIFTSKKGIENQFTLKKKLRPKNRTIEDVNITYILACEFAYIVFLHDFIVL